MSTLTLMTEVDGLREEIRQLFVEHARGDLRERSFQRALAQRSMDLYRAVVGKSMAAGESILQEHHVIRAHMRLTQSVLKEPEQEAISLFATDRRLIRLRSAQLPGRPATGDEQDRTVVDHVPLNRIEGFQVHRQIRPGEAWAGLAIAGIGILFYDWLSLTGPILIVLGILGALHGLLLPTRWMEVKAGGASLQDPLLIYAMGKKSGKALMRFLRERLPGASPSHQGT